MSVDRISLDANILFYAIDVDAGERHERAKEIVTRSARDFDCSSPFRPWPSSSPQPPVKAS